MKDNVLDTERANAHYIYHNIVSVSFKYLCVWSITINFNNKKYVIMLLWVTKHYVIFRSSSPDPSWTPFAPFMVSAE